MVAANLRACVVQSFAFFRMCRPVSVLEYVFAKRAFKFCIIHHSYDIFVRLSWLAFFRSAIWTSFCPPKPKINAFFAVESFLALRHLNKILRQNLRTDTAVVLEWFSVAFLIFNDDGHILSKDQLLVGVRRFTCTFETEIWICFNHLN